MESRSMRNSAIFFAPFHTLNSFFAESMERSRPEMTSRRLSALRSSSACSLSRSVGVNLVLMPRGVTMQGRLRQTSWMPYSPCSMDETDSRELRPSKMVLMMWQAPMETA